MDEICSWIFSLPLSPMALPTFRIFWLLRSVTARSLRRSESLWLCLCWTRAASLPSSRPAKARRTSSRWARFDFFKLRHHLGASFVNWAQRSSLKCSSLTCTQETVKAFISYMHQLHFIQWRLKGSHIKRRFCGWNTLLELGFEPVTFWPSCSST